MRGHAPVFVVQANGVSRVHGGAALRHWREQAASQLISSFRGEVLSEDAAVWVVRFADAGSCLDAAFALARSAEQACSGLQLRAAAHLARCDNSTRIVDARDLLLVHELARSAKPGEMLTTSQFHDQAADGVDADFEDLGHRRVLRGRPGLHLFRALPPGGALSAEQREAPMDRRPALAIMRFLQRDQAEGENLIGELIAEGVIARLSHSIGIRVLSRQSTSAFRGGEYLGEVHRHLDAAFVLTGTYLRLGSKLEVIAELADIRNQTILWQGRLLHASRDLLQQDSQLLLGLACAVAGALDLARVGRVNTQPLPRLDSNRLLLGGMALLHHHSPNARERGRRALCELAARHPRIALPRAWLAMAHVLRVITGESTDVERDTQFAQENSRRALDAEPQNAVALSVDGNIHCQLLGDPRRARQSHDAAIEANPSEPMAWLLRSVYSSMWGSSKGSVTEAYMARSLSPVDPLRYFFELLIANALLADRRNEEAIACARRSLRANRQHAPTLRLLLTAQTELGRIKEGRDTLRKLLAEVPGLTLSSYAAMGSHDSTMRQRCATALRQLGLT